jgi:hypothetical protein
LKATSQQRRFLSSPKTCSAKNGAWLSALGIEKKHILKFEDYLKAGRYLVVVNGSCEDSAQADSILSDTDHEGLHLHTETAA